MVGVTRAPYVTDRTGTLMLRRPGQRWCGSRLQPLAERHAMPALTRRRGDQVIDTHTGAQIIVAPTGYRANQVRIGIQASPRFQIFRREALARERAADPPDRQH
jgi:sRNA-binding carbon storage regulator CsrA